MRHFLLASGLLLSATAGCVLSSCSDDKLPAIKNQAYTDNFRLYNLPEDNLSDFLTHPAKYNLYPGQNARITKGNGNNATITIYGKDVDLATNSDVQGVVQNPSVIIGEGHEFSFPVVLEEDGDKYTFNGLAEAKYTSFSYSGVLDKEKLWIGIHQSFTQQYAGMIPPDGGEARIWRANSGDFLNVDWQTAFNPLEGTGITPCELLQKILNLSCNINAYTYPKGFTASDNISIAEILMEVFNCIRFNTNGDLQVFRTYRNVSSNVFNEYCSDSFSEPAFYYYPVDKQNLLVYLMPSSLFTLTYDDFYRNNIFLVTKEYKHLTAEIIKSFYPLCIGGIPLRYSSNSKNLSLEFKESAMASTLLKVITTTVLNDANNKNSMIAELAKVAEFAPYIDRIENCLDSIDKMFDNTTSLSLEFNYNPAVFDDGRYDPES